NPSLPLVALRISYPSDVNSRCNALRMRASSSMTSIVPINKLCFLDSEVSNYLQLKTIGHFRIQKAEFVNGHDTGHRRRCAHPQGIAAAVYIRRIRNP